MSWNDHHDIYEWDQYLDFDDPSDIGPPVRTNPPGWVYHAELIHQTPRAHLVVMQDSREYWIAKSQSYWAHSLLVVSDWLTGEKSISHLSFCREGDPAMSPFMSVNSSYPEDPPWPSGPDDYGAYPFPD